MQQLICRHHLSHLRWLGNATSIYFSTEVLQPSEVLAPRCPQSLQVLLYGEYRLALGSISACPGAGENERGEVRGDGGSGDQAKPVIIGLCPGEWARGIAVPTGEPARGENVDGACAQLKPPATGLGARSMPG